MNSSFGRISGVQESRSTGSNRVSLLKEWAIAEFVQRRKNGLVNWETVAGASTEGRYETIVQMCSVNVDLHIATLPHSAMQPFECTGETIPSVTATLRSTKSGTSKWWLNRNMIKRLLRM